MGLGVQAADAVGSGRSVVPTPAPGPARASRPARLAAHALYLGLSLLFASRFFPLLDPGTHAMITGDPAAMCWVLQWMSHALVHDPLHLYAGNILHPYGHAVTLFDPMVTLAILNTPVRLFTSNPWVGYNLLIVAAYYLSCVWGAALVRAITGSAYAAFWGGIFWGFLFFRVQHIGHLNILSFQAIPLVVVCLIRLWREPRARTALTFALVFVAQALVSWYLAVIAAVVVALVTLCRRPSEVLTKALVPRYLLAVAVLGAAVLPFAWPYQAGFADSTLADRLRFVDTLGDAVRLRDYLTPPVATRLGRMIAGNPYWIWGENTLYVGWVALVLGAAGLACAARSAGRAFRRWAATGVLLVVGGYVLALGFVAPRLGVRLPLHYLAQIVPAIGGMRATQRFSLVLYMGLLVLSGIAVAEITRRVRPAGRLAFTAAACALFLVEVYPVQLPISTDQQYSVSAPDRFIAKYQRGRDAPLVVLHLPIHYFVQSYPTGEATYMVDSTQHWARLLNGFAGELPSGFMERMTILNALPAPGSVALLRQLNVDVVAVHGVAARRGTPLFDFFSAQPWAHVIRFPAGGFVALIDR